MMPPPEIRERKRRVLILLQVLLVHLLVVFGPFGWLWSHTEELPEDAFTVELLGPPLQAEETGPPSRLPEPEVEPEPEPPAPEPEPEPEPPEPEVALPEAVSEAPVIPEPTAIQLPPVRPRPAPTRRVAEPTNLRLPPVRRPRPRPTARAQNTDPLIPLGDRERGQIRGTPNNRAPGGSRSNNQDPGFGQRVGAFLKLRWQQPPRSLLGGVLPEVEIELTVGADGRVLSSRIRRKSGIKAMDDSVARLLQSLTAVPRPTDGRTHTESFILKTEE